MNEETVVVQNGVTVRKSFSAEDFPVPAVTFAVTSTREQPVELRITDTIPEGFGVEQIGFHPDYGSEYWTATGDGGVRFERPVEPGEEFTTVYGVRMNADDEPTVFLEKPSVEVNPTEAAETADVVPEESSEVVRELARGERETVPGLETEASTDEPEDAEVEPTGAGADSLESEAEPSEDELVATELGSDEPEAETAAEAGSELGIEAGAGDESAAEPTLEADEDQAETPSSVAEADEEPAETPSSAVEADEDKAETPSSPADSQPTDAASSDESEATEPVADSAHSTAGSASEDSQAAESLDLESELDTSQGPASESDTTAEPESEREDVETGLDESDPLVDDTVVDTLEESTAAEPTGATDEPPAEAAGTTEDETTTQTESSTRTMPSETPTDSIVAAFAEEIEAGTIDDAHLSVIREALDEDRPSDRVRLEHLQSRVSDLEAYTDALERFLDEEGGGQQILDELEAEIESVEADLGDVGARLDAAAAERDTMSEHLENLENTVEALAGVAEQIERVRDDVEALDERLADVEEVSADVSELEAELETVRADLAEVTEWRDQLSDVFGP